MTKWEVTKVQYYFRTHFLVKKLKFTGLKMIEKSGKISKWLFPMIKLTNLEHCHLKKFFNFVSLTKSSVLSEPYKAVFLKRWAAELFWWAARLFSIFEKSGSKIKIS